ncbi:MAG: threo-3-hydroxy-L-aspartate ammonia-lyase [Planctomycetes bacterium]|jgi:threonine dehydratase|nr:threo-3-hydroxy-L-aspartate ammonia-lyase [Planctomycetota bacterium]MCL4731960.1 threo-3-hydroxy-L-aspartate ammonia-lyase [Planctomycetota bacterium]
MTVLFADIRAAVARLEGNANRTPVFTSRTADELTGASLFFKAESFQRGGAFKFRGAFNALSQLDPAQARQGVLTWSSGNHAQAIALAGRLLGIPRTIVMPQDAPAVKLAATRSYGAEVITYDKHTTTREELGETIARRRGLAIVPPYDHPHIIAGQGTAALELIEEIEGLDAVLTPCGGGGLLAGTAVATRHLLPDAGVYGAEPALADDACRSFRSGRIETVHNPATIADGARTPSLGKLNFDLIRRHVTDIVPVSEQSIIKAMLFLWERMKLVIEPTGALALGALMDGTLKLPGRRVGVILSGGNADFAALKPYL